MMSFISRYQFKRRLTIFSKILQQQLVRAIGR